jgi:hypothetical protein
LRWQDGNQKPQDAYLVFLAPEDPLSPNSDASSRRKKETHFLARSIETTKGKKSLIHSWITLCESHGSYCRESAGDKREFFRMLDQAQFGVIDVITLQVVELPCDQESQTHEKYIALSYVWGEKEVYKTLRSNVLKHLQHGGLEAPLRKEPNGIPKTIQDAIQLVKDIGLRYLWVDSLCIVQDSPRSLQINAPMMDLVYGNAHVTICAADGDDSSVGLVAMNTKDPADQLRAPIAPGVQLAVSRPAEAVIRDSVWNNRGWTFQERILSPRCLIFAGGRVYFQCRTTDMSEDIYTDGTGTGWSLDSTDAPLRTLQELKSRPMRFYMKCVPMYTGRQLTYSKDILLAFSGVCSLIQQQVHGCFHFGLPTSHFDLALLWQPITSTRRRRPDKKEGRHWGALEFPSWSWCGWQHAKKEYEGAKVEYMYAMLEGVLENVNEWLLNHTWICWYIRDGRGDLRPLWDKTQVLSDRSTDLKWKGYAAYKIDDSNSPGIYTERVLAYDDQYDEADRRRVIGEHVVIHPRSADASPERAVETVMDMPISVGSEQYGLREEDETRVIIREHHPQSEDQYGRLVHRQGQEQPWFRAILPDSPFKVRDAPFTNKTHKESLDMPVLQFWTLRTSLNVLHPANEKIEDQDELCRCDIADGAGDWCGSITLDRRWIQPRSPRWSQFIAISDAKAFTDKECKSWNYYVPKEKDESEWDLYYVLLIIPNQEDLIWERVALGKVFKAAFLGAEWDEIKLG